MSRSPTFVTIPTLVRVKPGALARSGIYLDRFKHRRICIVQSDGLPAPIIHTLRDSLAQSKREVVAWHQVNSNSFDHAVETFRNLEGQPQAVVGVGGGKALDVAKYIAFLAKLPYYSIPTSLSNDGFCSPQASLSIDGKRRSLATAMPFGVIIDAQLCSIAPRALSLSGVGDLVAKFTAVCDWKLSFHHTGELVDDFATLLSDASVYAYMSSPTIDASGLQLLGTSLMLNGIAMEVCGSSRPASGSEHLISHALDQISAKPRLHGLQVGVATYLMSLIHRQNSETIASIFNATGFWDAIARDPFSFTEWIKAIDLAPSIKPGYFTILSLPEERERARNFLQSDPLLKNCFVD